MDFDAMHILAVDDSIDVHNQLTVFLGSMGVENIRCVQSAAAAFELLGLTEGGTPNQAVDLILMDIAMEGINGIEATERIKAVPEFQDIPILMISGETSKESLSAAFDAGAVDYITKPLNRVELVTRVRSFLKLKAEIDTRKSREKDLEKALSEIKTLKGFIPICASCKKIRDDKGYWSQIEVYIRKHSEAQFTHGICPDCMKKCYPEAYATLFPNDKG